MENSRHGNTWLIHEENRNGNTTAIEHTSSSCRQIYGGVEQVEVARPISTRAKTVTAQYINPANFTSIGKIISTPTLVASEEVPTAVWFNFPTDTDPLPWPTGTTGRVEIMQ